MTTKKDDWKVILDGDDYASPTLPRPVSVRDVELLTHALYDKASLEYPMNEAPADVVDAGRAMIEASTATIRAMRAFAERVRESIQARDGPYPEPPDPEREKREDDARAEDLRRRSSHRPESR